MTIETSTANVLLLCVLTLQAWFIRRIFSLETKVSIILAHCKKCKNNNEFETDQITKKV
jgi:low affinity Fe/Cu permease